MPQTRKASQGPAKKTTKRKAAPGGNHEKMVAEAAYYRAEKRGFSGGNELGDWLEAEKEINQQLH